VTTFYFVRHGNAYDQNGNQNAESHLNADGIAQVEVLAQVLTGAKYDAILVSPLTRAQETAAIATSDVLGPKITVNELAEIGNDYWPNPLQSQDITGARDPEKELSEAKQGVLTTWNNLKKSYSGKKVLVFSHGNWIRVLLSILLDLDDNGFQRFKIQFTSLTIIEVDETKPDENTRSAILSISCAPFLIAKNLLK